MIPDNNILILANINKQNNKDRQKHEPEIIEIKFAIVEAPVFQNINKIVHGKYRAYHFYSFIQILCSEKDPREANQSKCHKKL